MLLVPGPGARVPPPGRSLLSPRRLASRERFGDIPMIGMSVSIRPASALPAARGERSAYADGPSPRRQPAPRIREARVRCDDGRRACRRTGAYLELDL